MMIKNTVAVVTLLLMLISSCQGIDNEQRAHDYYNALNTSNFQRIAELQYDSIRIKEGPFSTSYSVDDYTNWFQWDSVFRPSYKILDSKSVADGVELTISKVDERIRFLNDGPMVSKELMRFKDNKIYEVEIGEFSSFNGERWNSRRNQLVNWITENHPELDGFIIDQTLQGGLNYLEALALFKESQAYTRFKAMEFEKQAILATLNNETKAAFQRDYDSWQNYWVQDTDITKVYLDFPENTFSESLGWSEISGFVKTFFEEHPEPEPVPKMLDAIDVRLYDNGAWVTYEQQDSIRGRKRETRLMEKVGPMENCRDADHYLWL